MITIKAHYDVDQLNAAVEYIKENNPNADKWSTDYIRNTIVRLINDLRDSYHTTNPTFFTGTMGFVLMAGDKYWNEANTEFTISVDILLSPMPRRSNSSHYATVSEEEYSNNVIAFLYSKYSEW